MFLIFMLSVAWSPFMGKFPLFNWHSDPYGALVVSQNILKNHTLKLEKVKDYWKVKKGRYNYQIGRIGRDFYYSYPIGTPILSLPFVAVGNIIGLDMTKNEKVMQQTICMFIAAFLFVILFLIARFYFSFYLSLIAGLLGFYGTTVGTVVGTGLWNFDFEICFIALATYILLSSIQKEDNKIPSPINIGLGLSLFAAYISRPTAAFFILSVFLFLADSTCKCNFWD